MIFLDILLILFFVLMNAFFVVSEFAMVKVRKSRIEVLAAGGSAAAKYTEKVVNDLNTYLSACQLGITLASLALGWLGEPTVSKLISPILVSFSLSESVIHTVSVIIGFVVITGLHIVLGELVPKSLAILNSEKFSTGTAIPLVLFYRATYPIMWMFNHITALILKLMGYSMADEKEAAHTDEEIKSLLKDSYDSGFIEEHEYTYVDNIFHFGDKKVKDIMIPRTEMCCIFIDTPIEEIFEIVRNEKHTRYPICEEDKDNVIGFIHMNDLYESYFKNDFKKIDSIIRDIVVAPENITVDAMLKMFQQKKEQIAIVVDEYGGTCGVVTVEDIIEEIVGDIDDEYDEVDKDIEVINESTYMIKGSMKLDELNDETGMELPSDEIDTLSGFLINELGKVPKKNEKPIIQYKNFIFEVQKVENRRIELVKLLIQKVE